MLWTNTQTDHATTGVTTGCIYAMLMTTTITTLIYQDNLVSRYYYYYYTRLTAFFQDYLGKPVPEGQTILDFTDTETMGWQWHQLDHMQVIRTSLLTDSQAGTSSLWLDALPAAQPTAPKHRGQRMTDDC